ncbi:MAG: PAS domain S-box protein, partial [Burkholderiaceae bacterium]|nr:PAS domain S-box protein [Burkholderiaceae bacterium]
QLSDGTHAGTLCVIDRQPRRLDAKQREVLGYLATAAVRALEGRRALLAERELLDTASKAAAVLSNSLDAILTLSLNGTITHWNAPSQRLFGYSSAQMLGQPRTALVPPDSPDELDDLATRLKESPTGFNFETVRRHQDGTLIAVSVSVAPIYNAHGDLTGFTKIIRDIRAQVRAAKVLADSESRFRALSETSPLGVFEVDSQGSCTYTNAQWQAIHGLSLPQSLGDGWTTVLHPEDRAAVIEAWQQAFARCLEFDQEFRILRPDGLTRSVRSRAKAQRAGDGSITGYVGSLEDITERLVADSALKDERLRLASIIEGTSAGTWEWNVQTGEVRINEQWASTMGYTRAEMAPLSLQSWEDCVHLVDLERSRERLKKHLAGEAPNYECEIRVRHRAGHWVWVLDRGRVLTFTADGQPEWMFGTHLDISELKRQDEALRKSEQLLNRTGEVAGVGGWECDLRTNVMVWSKQTCRIYGVEVGYVPTAEGAAQFYPPEVMSTIDAAVTQAKLTGQGWDLELPLIQATGKRIWVRSVGTVLYEGGKPIKLMGAVQDVTDLRNVTAQLASQHELLQVTLQSIGDAVITTDAVGRVTWLNPVAERMTGWLNAQAKGHPVSQVFHIVHEETRAVKESPVSICLQQGKVVGLANYTLLISRTGEEFGVQDSASPIRNERGALFGVVLVFHDVTEQRRLSGEMTYRATHDMLTGLFNRAEFESRLDHAFEKSHEDCSEHALLFIDLDQFKLINDACGHTAGDQFLQQIGKLILQSVRAHDTVARLGGDEFAVILDHCPIDQAQPVAQKICDRIDDFRFAHDQKRFRTGASIGLVSVGSRWNTTAAIIQAADSACYAAKEAGRSRVHVWLDTDQAMRARHGEMQWAARIEHALDDNRFTLYAQRIEALDTQVHGLYAEVLVRMLDTDGSVVQPGAFLPAAERFHLASRIDRWVLRHSIDVLGSLTNLSTVETLCVNLSGQSIGDRAFHRHAIDLLTQAGAEVCRCLCLEITETAAVTNMADAGVFIDQVRALGVRIALDDFGAGASSFGYLKSLNVDLIKIDGQFIRDLIDDPLDDAAVRCFVEVAQVVGVKTVAEFVDRAEVLDRVRAIGIDFAQGYFLHQPERLSAVLKAQGCW